MGRHRSDPRGLGRYLLLVAVAVVALALVVVGVLALRGTLTSKKPPHTPTPSHSAAQRSAVTPVLLIKVVREPCYVFVKNATTGNVLQPDNTEAPRGVTLQFSQVPLLVQISEPTCADVYVHGLRKPAGPAGKSWIFTIQT